jgi:ribosomal protein L37AE/L43A
MGITGGWFLKSVYCPNCKSPYTTTKDDKIFVCVSCGFVFGSYHK